MRRRVCILILLCLASVAAAQDVPRPLLLQGYETGLWSYQPGDDAPVQVNASECAGSGIISPDAKYIACTEFTEYGYDVGLDEFSVANNITVLNLADDSETTLTTQPDDLSNEHFIVRSQPTWSPDSTRFAWAEFYYPEQNQSVFIHDVTTGETTTLLEDMAAEASAPLAVLEWGAEGIAYDYNVFEVSGQGLVYQSVTILTPEGQIRYAADVDIITPRVRFTFGGMWLKFEDVWQYGELFNDGTWQVFDPAAQTTRIVTGHLELHSTVDNAPLRLSYQPQQGNYEVSGVNQGKLTRLTTLDYLFNIHDRTTALSPDGTMAAFKDGTVLKLWDGTKVSAVPLTGVESVRRIAWGDTYFVLVED